MRRTTKQDMEIWTFVFSSWPFEFRLWNTLLINFVKLSNEEIYYRTSLPASACSCINIKRRTCAAVASGRSAHPAARLAAAHCASVLLCCSSAAWRVGPTPRAVSWEGNLNVAWAVRGRLWRCADHWSCSRIVNIDEFATLRCRRHQV